MASTLDTVIHNFPQLEQFRTHQIRRTPNRFILAHNPTDFQLEGLSQPLQFICVAEAVFWGLKYGGEFSVRVIEAYYFLFSLFIIIYFDPQKIILYLRNIKKILRLVKGKKESKAERIGKTSTLPKSEKNIFSRLQNKKTWSGELRDLFFFSLMWKNKTTQTKKYKT